MQGTSPQSGAPTNEQDEAIRRRVARESIEGMPPSATFRRWRATVVFTLIALAGVTSVTVGTLIGGVVGAAVSVVILIAGLVAASPVLGAYIARRKEEQRAGVD